MELEGKVAVVTGSSSGIGRATAELLAAHGVRVVVNYARSAEEAHEVVASIRAAGGEAHAVQANVGTDAECRALIQEAVDTFGALHILVNNAGTTRYIAHHRMDEVTDDAWDEIMRVNVQGMFNCTRAAVPHMREAGEGVVVNVSSISAVASGGSSIPYAASKAAVNNITMQLAKVLAPEIRINAIAPAVVETRWAERGLGAERAAKAHQAEAERTPLGRIATPDDCAGTILSLIRYHTFMTGQTLEVDGGQFL